MFGWIKKLFSRKKSAPPAPDWLDRELSIYAPPASSKVVLKREEITPRQQVTAPPLTPHSLHPRHSIRPTPLTSTEMRREVPPISLNGPGYGRTTEQVVLPAYDARTDESVLLGAMLVQALTSHSPHEGCDERVKPAPAWSEPAPAPAPTPSYSYTEPAPSYSCSDSSSSYSSSDSSSCSSSD